MAPPYECDDFQIPGLVEGSNGYKWEHAQSAKKRKFEGEGEGDDGQVLPSSKVLERDAVDTQASVTSYTSTKSLALESQGHLQVAFLMLSELGQPVEGPLDGKLLRLESCRTIIDIYATMTAHLGCAFPRGEPSPAVVEILITFPFRHEADEQPHESTNRHHTNDQDTGVWKNIALSHNMSRLADVTLIYLDFTEAGHLDASPPKIESKAYTNFRILIARKLEKRATQKSLDVPLDFIETAMRHIAISGQRSETQKLELESIRAAELNCQEQIQTLQKELKDKQLEIEGLEREVRRKEAQLWRVFVPARWEEWLG